MAPRKAQRPPAEADPAQRLMPRVPVQQRSRERFERILACAVEVMAEKGSEAFRMSDIVERTGIAFGSLYQYFPDKTTLIGTLAQRYNDDGRACVRKELSALKRLDDLHDVLCAITDSYYQFFVDEPAVRDIWQATQADRLLQKLDEEDGRFLASLLAETLRAVAPQASAASLKTFSQVTMVLIAAAVRHAIMLPPKEARRALQVFKSMLPEHLPSQPM